MKNYSAKYLDIDHYRHFIDKELADDLFEHFSENFNQDYKRRQTLLYGTKGLIYRVQYGGYGGKDKITTKHPVINWKHDDILYTLKQQLEEITEQKYNVCVVQYYPNGRIGINPHKDREMIKGTSICGISLGHSRNLIMHPPKFLNEQNKIIRLRKGSLYVLNTPTNQYWMHEIEKDSSTTPRISLTFRNYK